MQLPNFKNKQLFTQAFTHRSYLNESKVKRQSNERLEFLGDSILSFIVSSYIFEKNPLLMEGELTNLRVTLINTTTLYQLAHELDLGKHLMLSKGEEASGGRENRTILANTLEAFIGALFLDQGLDAVKTFIQEILLSRTDEISQLQGLKDAKSMLQEITQEQFKTSPNYQIVAEEGPDHAKLYTAAVFLKDRLLAKGKGQSKQEAEKNAAKEALTNL